MAEPAVPATAATPWAAPPATGLAQTTVIYDFVPGTLVFSATDPSGHDNGPGHLRLPDFARLPRWGMRHSAVPGVRQRDRQRDLPSADGGQLVDVYVHNASGGTTSTAASFPGGNYAIDAGSAWNRLIEVQGFGQRFVDAGPKSGQTKGSVQIRADSLSRFITFTVSKSALGGTPASGWSFAVVLTGQDGFSPDQARDFASTAQLFQFGECTAAAIAASNPICALDPATLPKAVDILTPGTVSQADELNPTLHSPVTIQGVRIP